jgi:hypothetical protein
MSAPEMLGGMLRGTLFPSSGLSYRIEHESSHLPWPIRNNERYWTLFYLHLLRARKLA